MKLGTRMHAGVTFISPGHGTPPIPFAVFGQDSFAITDATAIVAGSATEIVVSDTLELFDGDSDTWGDLWGGVWGGVTAGVTAMSFTDADDLTMTDLAVADSGAPIVVVVAGDTTLPGVSPPRLPKVYHVISSRAGVDNPDVRDWFAEESAPGGFGPAGGVIDATRAHDQPGIYTPGALWQMWTEDGFLLWEGTLSNAIMHDGFTELVARGWSYLAERDAGRLLFMTHPEMVPADSDPFNINISDAYEIDASGSRISFIGRKGEKIDRGNKSGAVFWAEGAELNSVAFKVDSNGGSGATDTNDVFIQSGIGPSPTYVELREDATIHLDAGEINRRLDSRRDNDLLFIELRRTQAVDSLNNTLKVTVSDIRVRSLANSDEMSYSNVAREVASRLGVSDAGIRDTGDNVLPLDFTDGSFAELLDYGAMVSGTRWLFRSVGNGPVCEVDEWDADRWYTSRDQGPTDLIPVSRYNSVVVAYPAHNGRHRVQHVTASDIGVADPYATTGYTNAFHIEIDQKQAGSDLAQSIGVNLLTPLIKERFSGSLTRAFLEGKTGHYQPAYRAKAGGTIYVQDGKPGESVAVRVSRKRSTAQGVTFELDEREASVDSFLERRKNRISVR